MLKPAFVLVMIACVLLLVYMLLGLYNRSILAVEDVASFMPKSTLPTTTTTRRSAAKCKPLPKTFNNLGCEMDLSPKPSLFPSPPLPPAQFPEIESVHVLVDTNWGFTCNKLEILSGAIYNVLSTPRNRGSALALGPVISNLVKNLDLRYLAQDFPVLFDCNICKESVHCQSMVRAGSARVELGEFEYPITQRYVDADMYWKFGPSSLQFSTVLARYLIPAERIRLSVEKIMQRNAKHKLLGVHRRNIDGWCYQYVGGGNVEYECAANAKLNREIDMLFIEDPETLYKNGNFAQLKQLEIKHPMLMTCNYSMDSTQIEILHRSWPQAFPTVDTKFDVLFTTDSNDLQGDAKLLKSKAIHKHFKLETRNVRDAMCTNENHPQRPHRLMLKEMYALALTDFHMANPCSSCDVIVVHWRRMLNKPVGSSFPPLCYDGQYESSKLDTWYEDMAFYKHMNRTSITHEPTLQPTKKEISCPPVSESYDLIDCEREFGNLTESIFPFDGIKPPYPVEGVHLLVDTDWGFTCNKLEILSGAMYNVMHEKRGVNSSLALGTTLSSMVKNLDLTILSQDFPILLDCNECESTVNCLSIVVNGEMRPGGVFPIYKRHVDADMYWYYGPSALRFSVVLAKYVVPSKALRMSTENAMSTAKSPLLGVHRRDIDGWCYEFLGSGEREYECAPNAKLSKEIAALAQVGTKTLFEQGNHARLQALEREHPMLMTCNYTMDSKQLEILARTWPQVFSNNTKTQKFDVLFTTDSNDKPGDEKLLNSTAINSWFKLEHMGGADGSCTNEHHRQRPHRLMLKEMYALALADYHMANPCSSCDVIVVHWRRMLGKPVGSSFPPLCFNGQYETNLLAEWTKMPFYD